MKAILTTLVILFAAGFLVTQPADAKRFGGGMSLGKQYSVAPRSAPRQSTPSRPQASAPRAGTTGASRWLGPLAGLAAGGLLASLVFGDAFHGLQLMDILVVGALIFGGMMLFRAMRRNAPSPAGAPGYGGPGFSRQANPPGFSSSLGEPTPEAPDADRAPPWFDESGFTDGAKTHFIRLQAAWDQADFRDIREYVTPELLAELQRERQQLGAGPQYTEVVTLNAELLDVRRDGDQVVASVLFSGLIREEVRGAANPFREIWHVQHAWETREGDWHIAGIQQAQE
jgi:predicted lipid-binding transport protein (Tim44 family)